MVTGLPLVQVQDLELPFGGASFRLIRTRSGGMGFRHIAGSCGPLDRWWDWTGEGWMMSEQPFLYIDSAVPDIVGNQPRTTYLALDAHHSIPFQLIESSGRYEAPPRFRARLEHNGINWNSSQRKWQTDPTWYKIHLYDGQLTYTFGVIYEDVPKKKWYPCRAGVSACNNGQTCEQNPNQSCPSSYHDRPFLLAQFPPNSRNDWNPTYHDDNPGLGIPYYGLLTRIEDQTGHVVDVTYCGFRQSSMDNALTSCVECQQTCPAKGQIKSIRLSLRSTGSTELQPQWVLFYKYRVAADIPWTDGYPYPSDCWPFDLGSQVFDIFGRRVVDSIFVYKVDATHAEPAAPSNLCNPISSAESMMGTNTQLEASHLDGADLAPADFAQIGRPWQYRVRYHYSFKTSPTASDQFVNQGMLHTVPLLLKTSVWSRSTSTATPPPEPMLENKVFLYRAQRDQEVVPDRDEFLECVFFQPDIDRALDRARSVVTGATNWIDVNYLALWRTNERIGNNDLSVIAANSVLGYELTGCASIRLAPRTAEGTGAGLLSPDVWESASNPRWEAMFRALPNGSAYMKQQASTGFKSARLNPQTGDGTQEHRFVERASVVDEQGKSHHYRIFRIAKSETNHADAYAHCHRSAFHAPYAWLGYTTYRGSGAIEPENAAKPPTDYTQARWINIIDEFESRDELFERPTAFYPMTYGDTGTVEGDCSTGYCIKPGQLSRRVVEVSATGVVLRDRSWLFTQNGVVTSGSGLGEEYVYETGQNMISALGLPIPPAPTESDPSTPPTEPGTTVPPDAFANLRRELLLVEYRSIGWSAAYLADSQGSSPPPEQSRGLHDGLVKFYEYKPYFYDTLMRTTVPTQWDENFSVTLKIAAEGMSRGRYYVGRDQTAPFMLQQNAESVSRRQYTQQVIWPSNLNATSSYGDLGGNNWQHECTVQFLTPQASASLLSSCPAPEENPGSDSPLYVAVHTLTQRDASDQTIAVPLRRMTGRLTIGVPRRQRPETQDSTWYRPIDREWYDDHGKKTWAASGLVANPLNPQPVISGEERQSLALTRQYYYDDSKLRASVVDYGSWATAQQHAQAPGGVRLVESDFSGATPWPRIGLGPALNYVTLYEYNNPGGNLSDVYHPNQRRWASRVVTINKNESQPGYPELCWNRDNFTSAQYGALPALPPKKEYAREYVFNDIETGDTNGSTHLVSRSLGEVRDYHSLQLGSGIQMGMAGVSGQELLMKGGGLKRTRRVFFASSPSQLGGASPTPLESFLSSPQADQQPRFVQEAKVEIGVDANGRAAQMDLLEASSDGSMQMVGRQEENDLVDIYRRKEIDGSIARVTRNLLGQPLRMYLGTLDDGWTLPQSQRDSSNFNMVLTERTEYGGGINDAWKPRYHLRYTKTPSWGSDFHGAAPAGDVDQDGYVTRTTYDWRMRPVRVDSFGEDPATGSRKIGVAPVLSSTLTYFDLLDRPILVVSYGTDALSESHALNPSLRLDFASSTAPDVTAFFAQGLPRPTSVELTRYSPDGSVVERRRYDTSEAATGASYQSEFTYNGRSGQEVYSQRPSQPVSIGRLDALGRTTERSQVGSRTTGWTYQLGRTDFVVDPDGNTVDAAGFERTASSSDTLTSQSGGGPNAVRSRTVTWYDAQRRLVASAELGTESSSGGFEPANPSFERYTPANQPTPPYFAPTPSLVPDPPNAPTAMVINRATLPNSALLSTNHYDLLTGRLTFIGNPDGSITENVYGKAGRLIEKVENRFGALPLRRSTLYEYQFGRLVSIIAKASTGSSVTQKSSVSYQADVMEQSLLNGVRKYTTVSRNNGVVGTMSFESEGGAPKTQFTLRYTFDGKIAERIDGRGIVFRYFYDGLGRLAELVVGYYDSSNNFVEGFPDWLKPASTGNPTERIAFVKYSYHPRGWLEHVRAYSSRGGSIITHNQYAFDDRGNLTGEWQSYGAEITTSNQSATPKIDYAWEYRATALTGSDIGRNRLASMTYPQHDPNTLRRIVNFRYGNNTVGSAPAANDDDDVISRITKLTTTIGTFTNDVATFTYAGVGRRSSLTLGYNSGRTVLDFRQGSTNGLPGLDAFGRIKDMHYKNVATTPATLYRAEYTYDSAGNRLSQKITQAPVGGTSQTNTRSQLHTYDELNRLLSSQVGQLNTSTNPPTISSTSRQDSWTLDLLGNWMGQHVGNTAGRFSSGNLNNLGSGTNYPRGGTLSGSTVTPWAPASGAGTDSDFQIAVTHNITGPNQISSISTYTDPGGTGSTTTLQPRYDTAGNLVFDGTYAYQYDAWCRLVQINRAHLITPSGSNTSPPNPYFDIALDAIVKHYTYDGLGRLVRTTSPYPDPDTSVGDLRTERFFYDGVRRIQEVVSDPVENLMNAAAGGESAAMMALNSDEELDAQSVTLQSETNQLNGEGNQIPSAGPVLEREYIWGPGDNGVDELFVQYDRQRVAWWVVQDAGGDVAALCETPSNGNARVAAQFIYDAYGNVQSADHLYPHAYLRAGHKGLFFDRLDAGTLDANGNERPRLTPFATLVGYNRNRSYNPQLGRFMQMDPLSTAMVLVGAGNPGVPTFDLAGRFTDGANLFGYLGNNTFGRWDPNGTFFTLSEMSWSMATQQAKYGALAGGITRGIRAALRQDATPKGVLAEMFKGAAIGGVAGFVGGAIAGQLGTALGLESCAFATSAVGLMARLGTSGVGGAASAGVENALDQVDRNGGMSGFDAAEFAESMAWGALFSAALEGIGPSMFHSACFVADTVVWTPDGPRPIQDLCVCDRVLTDNPDAEGTEVDPETWRTLTLVIPDHTFKGRSIEITTLKPAKWLDEVGARPGSWIPYDLPDMGVMGPAKVLSVSQCPPIKPGKGRVVLSTYRRMAGNVMELRVDGQDEPIGVTANHPVYSVERGEWVAVGDLDPSECIRTLSGITLGHAVTSSNQTQPVWNLEIEVEHVYAVSQISVLVHNAYPAPRMLNGAMRPSNGHIRGFINRQGELVLFNGLDHGMGTRLLDEPEMWTGVQVFFSGGKLQNISPHSAWSPFSATEIIAKYLAEWRGR